MTVTLDLAELLASTAPEDAPHRRQLSAISLAVARARRIVVVTGAGISCSCGIPDFRSSDGLYNLVKSRYPSSFLRGRDLFDASLFRSAETTQLFYTFIAELKRSIDNAQPGPTHTFLKHLDGKGRLLRSYTQNIDGFEERVGISTARAGPSSEGKENDPPSPTEPSPTPSTEGSSTPEPDQPKTKSKPKRKNSKMASNIQLHGDIHAVRCTLCAYSAPFSALHGASFLEGEAPECPACVSRSAARAARSARPLPQGHLRPAIVLYDEPHPLGEEIGRAQTADMARGPDLLIVMGTSLKVHGLKRLVKDFAGVVHDRAEAARLAQEEKAVETGKAPKTATGAGSMLGKVIFVNRTPPPGEWSDVIDFHIQGETDAWVQRVEEEWKKARPQDWEVQTSLDGLGGMKVGKPAFPVGRAKGEKKPAVIGKPKRQRKARQADGNSSDAENIPLSQASTLTSTSNSSGKTLAGSPVKSKLVPLSPSKRANTTSHYCSDSSPQKRHSPDSKSPKKTPLGERKLNDQSFPEKGMLFGSPKKAGSEEDLALGALSLVSPPKRKLRARTAVPVRA